MIWNFTSTGLFVQPSHNANTIPFTHPGDRAVRGDEGPDGFWVEDVATGKALTFGENDGGGHTLWESTRLAFEARPDTADDIDWDGLARSASTYAALAIEHCPGELDEETFGERMAWLQAALPAILTDGHRGAPLAWFQSFPGPHYALVLVAWLDRTSDVMGDLLAKAEPGRGKRSPKSARQSG